MTFTAGIDAGTQSMKVVVYDGQAQRIVASRSAALELSSGADGSREQHPDAWTQAIRQCFAGIDGEVRSRIKAIAVSGQQHGFVPMDADGEVLAPAKLWCDTSSNAECAEITDAVGGASRCIELAGNPILTGYTASNCVDKKAPPEAYRRLARILLPHDYLNFWLTGEAFCEAGDVPAPAGWMCARGAGQLKCCRPPIRTGTSPCACRRSSTRKKPSRSERTAPSNWVLPAMSSSPPVGATT